MKPRFAASCALLSAVLLAGCDQGRQPPEQVSVRVVNAAPGYEELIYQREQVQRDASTLPFKSSSTTFTYDVDTYDFFVIERPLSQNETPPRTTFRETLRAGNDYTLVITETSTGIGHTLLEYTPPAATSAQIVAAHAGGGLPAVDLYLEAPGLGIGGAAPRGTLNPLGTLTPRTLPTGQYEIFLTAAGNPGNVLFRSNPIALAAGETAALVVTAEGNQGPAALSVLLLQANPSGLYDRDTPTALRVLNGAANRQPRDFAIARQFSPPLFGAIPFGVPTVYAILPPAGSQPINVTPVGNPGVLELDQTHAPLAGQRGIILFTGEAGTLQHAFVPEDGRRLRREAKVRFLNGASQFALLDFILLPAGVSPTDAFADTTLATPGASAYHVRRTGAYDLYLRQGSAIVSGPTRMNLTEGGIYGVLAVNGPDTATAGVVFFDDAP